MPMLPSALVLILAALLTVRWGVQLVKKIDVRNVFTFLSRLYFALIYGYITALPPNEDLRALIRIGLFVLFSDELMNWLAVPTMTWIAAHPLPWLKQIVSKLTTPRGTSRHD